MFMWKGQRDGKQGRARPSTAQLSRGSRFERTTPIVAGVGRGFERGAERLVVAQGFEIGIVAGEGAVFGIQGYRALQVRDGFGVLVALCVRHGEHVNRVIVVGIFVADQAQMRDGLVVLPTVDGEGRGVQAFIDGLGCGFLLRRLALTDVEVEPDPLVKLLFLRIQAKDRFQEACRLLICVPLQGFEAPLIQCDRLKIGGSPLWSRLYRCRLRRSCRGGRADVDRSRRTSSTRLVWGFCRTGYRPLLGHKRRESAIKSRFQAVR